jgi:hypothetical protein
MLSSGEINQILVDLQGACRRPGVQVLYCAPNALDLFVCESSHPAVHEVFECLFRSAATGLGGSFHYVMDTLCGHLLLAPEALCAAHRMACAVIPSHSDDLELIELLPTQVRVVFLGSSSLHVTMISKASHGPKGAFAEIISR